MPVAVIIPARYDSTRFPGKPLYPLKGKPLIQHVYENSKKSRLAEEVMVATDSETIFERVLAFGGKAVMTDKNHPSGTDRIAEVAASLDYDIIVNVQGDEPLIRPEMIDDVIMALDDTRASIGTLIKKIEDPGEIVDYNVVKVVFDRQMFAVYFSRATIPFRAHHSEVRRPEYYKHIGIYSYRRDVLLSIAGMEPTELENIEKLEQLRALENGMKIKVKETFLETFGVDTPEDLERVEKCLSISS
ncbi:MAG TPA: 3-deoxy-manno-octulosonate cytidylyltransferase [Thermodesulfovibrionales bacterium]|nr:3-deoxy-manno-octulosonate cytidylyltransferase [Thermodesulfovibrionales bacterium]